jgi:hypothetical protein
MDQGDSLTKADLAAALPRIKREIVDEIAEPSARTEIERLRGLPGQTQELRLRSLEGRQTGIIERLANIKERLLDLQFLRPSIA